MILKIIDIFLYLQYDIENNLHVKQRKQYATKESWNVNHTRHRSNGPFTKHVTLFLPIFDTPLPPVTVRDGLRYLPFKNT